MQTVAEERRAFVCPPGNGVVDEIDLSLLNPADEDDQRFLIEAEHPELRHALDDDVAEIQRGGEAMNPRLHIAVMGG